MSTEISIPQPDLIPEKPCKKCGESKPATTEYFAKAPENRDRLTNACKVCLNEVQRQKRKENPQRYRGYDKKKRETKREQVAETLRRWYLKNREHKRAYDREYYAGEKGEKIRQDAREYYANNTDHVKRRIWRWQKANPHKIKHYRHRNYKRYGYTEKMRANHHQRRARKRNAPGSFTPEDIQRQYANQHGKCYWCAKKLRGKFEIDHVVPLFRGGSNYPDNLVCSCVHCNRSKGAKLLNEWGRLL